MRFRQTLDEETAVAEAQRCLACGICSECLQCVTACSAGAIIHDMVPEDAHNLHDLGVCSMVLARDQFRRRNFPAAMREVDQAIEYYARSINAHPGFQASLEGKNRALELKGQFEQALQQAEWAREFVGPSARQQVFLARELEERGDMDGALLRYR